MPAESAELRRNATMIEEYREREREREREGEI